MSWKRKKKKKKRIVIPPLTLENTSNGTSNDIDCIEEEINSLEQRKKLIQKKIQNSTGNTKKAWKKDRLKIRLEIKRLKQKINIKPKYMVNTKTQSLTPPSSAPIYYASNTKKDRLPPMSLSHPLDTPSLSQSRTDIISQQTLPATTTNSNISAFDLLFESFGPRGHFGSNSFNFTHNQLLIKSKSHGVVSSASPLGHHGTHFPFLHNVYSYSRKDENEWESDISSSASKAHSVHSQPTPYLWANNVIPINDNIENEHSLSNPPMILQPSNTQLVEEEDLMPITSLRDDSLLPIDDEDDNDYFQSLIDINIMHNRGGSIDQFKLNRNTIIESIMDIYSHSNRCWITVGAILNGYKLYLVSAKQFQIYQEFIIRTKYEEIINEEEEDYGSDDDGTVILDDKGTIINMIDAEQMIKNLNINIHDKDKEMTLKTKMMDFLIGKTKYDIQRYILLNPNNISTLSSLFGIDDIDIANINCIRIHGFYNEGIIPIKMRDDFVDYMMSDIIYIDQDVSGDCLLITFEQYLYPKTINIIRERMYCFLDKNVPFLTEKQLSSLDIQPHYEQISNSTITDRIIICDLTKQYDYIEPFEMKQIGKYGFELKTDSMKSTEEKAQKEEQDEIGMTMTCIVNSNNLRHSWIAHIDYAIWRSRKHPSSDDDDDDMDDIKYDDNGNRMPSINGIEKPGKIKKKSSSKFTNDFDYITDQITTTTDDGSSDDDEEEKEKEKKIEPETQEFVQHFGFGQNWNYWISGYEDSVVPIFNTLKRELMNNNVYKLDEEEYDYLYKKGLKLMKTEEVQKKYRAKYVGINNKKYIVPPNSKMTINHLITIISYCDFSTLPCEFKKLCRKINHFESDQDFKRRNSEIANWCRYLKECCIFFGQLMSPEQRFYTGLSKKLIFGSLFQNFECPVSTTGQRLIADKFSDSMGIILQLKAGNDRTTYFDTTWLSIYDQEEERLIMGCSLIICDILFRDDQSDGLCGCREWIYALRLFEKIINGHSFSWISSLNRKKPTQIYLNHLIKYYKNKENKAPKYIIVLFENLCEKSLIKKQNGNERVIWLNRSELNRLKHKKLRTLFYDLDGNKCGEFLTKFNIKSSEIKWIQEFKWKIDGNQLKIFKNLKQRKYLSSNKYSYHLNNKQTKNDINDTILFNLTSCAKYSYEMEECALFLEIKQLPPFCINGINISIERICKECNYQNIMMPQWLSLNPINLKESIGSRVFPTIKLKNIKSLTWSLAIKLLKIE